MKKLLCTLLAIAMLCSLMVVNVSARSIYEEGFEFETNYDISIECVMSERGFSQYTVTSSELIGDIIICTQKWFDVPEDLYYENYDYYTSGETVLNGNTAAYVENISDGYYEREMQLYSEYYYYTLHIRAYDEESYNAWLEIIDGFTFNYEDGMYYEYYEEYFPTTSTYWETDYFYIDTDMELVMKSDYYDEGDEYSFYPVEYDEGWGYQDIGAFIDISVCQGVDIESKYQELLDERDEWFEEISEDDWDICEREEIAFNGFEAIQETLVMYDDGEIEPISHLSKTITFCDSENIYMVSVDCENEDTFNDLCDIVENDLHFNNAPVEDEKSEDKSDKTDKENKEDKGDEEKDNSTVIIVVAVIAGVVILGVTAIIVLGKKKKQ